MSDTICAIGTPAGMGGISIIRISGPDALPALQQIFFPKRGAVEQPRYAYLGDIRDGAALIDQAIGIWYRAPYSYTGEEVCEIQCHGGMVVTNMILELLIRRGVRPAAPGEFTKRAFLNGKLSLDEAESVQEHISAMSVKGAMESAKRLEGRLTEKIRSLQDSLTDSIAKMEAAVEYPEEELPVIEECARDISVLREEVDKLLATYESGKLLQEGMRIAICGTPNVGKSSLLNAILGESRAIVTNIPGTTRDVLKEYYVYRGVPLIFSDTAGIRATEDIVEKMGVDRSLEVLDACDAALFLLDASREIEAKDWDIAARLRQGKGTVIAILNKTDLPAVTTCEDVKERLGFDAISISAATGEGINAVLERIYQIAEGHAGLAEGLTISNVRHKNALLQARQSLEDAERACVDYMDADCISIDLMDAWRSLGEITGETVSEDIIDRIFSKFCLGK